MGEISDNGEYGKVLLVDKPLHWTSFDVVKKLRNTLNVKKIGHAGTLDPLATGLLILCTGKKTKEIEQYQGLDKEYKGTFVLGQTTPSYDLETEVTEARDISHIKNDDLKATATQLTGLINQIPPIYSAVRVGGRRSYKNAREGKKVELKPRSVNIKRFDIDTSSFPVIAFTVICSKGTYIRSLVNDFGQLLGVGAYLSSLRRTKIGKYSVSDAQKMEGFVQ